jgi:hypothetical protein
MRSKLERDVLVLKTYALVASLVCLALVTTGLGPGAPERARFTEIDVERINVVEADGRLRLVISNRERQHPGVVDGVATPRPQGRPPGILFFNHQGNEAGGLLVGENGGQGHALSLTFDKSRQDQTVGLQHLESDDGTYFAGLKVWDRPNTSLADFVRQRSIVEQMPAVPARERAVAALHEAHPVASRIVVGRGRDESAVVTLADGEGRTRLRLIVDPQGDPRIELLDANGEVVDSMPRREPARPALPDAG